MVFTKITGIIIIILGIFIGLNHFNIISTTLFGFNLVTIGIIIFIAHEALALVMNLSSGNKIVSIGVPLLFILIAGSYFVQTRLPQVVSSNMLLIISILMIVEGLYRLH